MLAVLVKLAKTFPKADMFAYYRRTIGLRATRLKARRRSVNCLPPKQPDPLSDARQTLLDPLSWALQTPTYLSSLSPAPVGARGVV